MSNRTLRWAALALLLQGCAAKKAPREIADELPIWMTQGETVRLGVAQKLLDTGNSSGALEVIRVMRQEGYDMPELDLLQGIALRQEQLTSEAERLLLQADSRLKRDPRALRELCILYADAQELEKAVAACTQATEYEGAHAATWNNLSFLLLSSGRPEEALRAAEQAVKLDSTEPRYRNNLAMAQVALGRAEQGFRTFQSTLPRSAAAFNVAVVLERFSDPSRAMVYYERTLDYEPHHAEAMAAIDRLGEAEPPGAVAPKGDTP